MERGRNRGPGQVPMRRPGYPNQPPLGSGSFDTDPSDIERKLPIPIDMRGQTEWRTVLAHDCSEKSWGQVLVTCDAFPSQTAEGGNDPEAWPHCEVRIIADVNGQRVILLEAAVGNHNIGWVIGDDSKSSGPVFLPLYPGEVPDRIEVLARARRGGDPQTTYDVDERLQLFAVARFHR